MPQVFLLGWILDLEGSSFEENMEIYLNTKPINKYHLYSVNKFIDIDEYKKNPKKLNKINKFLQWTIIKSKREVNRLIYKLKKGGDKWFVERILCKHFPEYINAIDFIDVDDVERKGELNKNFLKMLSPKLKCSYLFPHWSFIKN